MRKKREGAAVPDIRLIKIPKPGDEIPKDQSRDAWATPPAIFREICENWGFKPAIDGAAESHNTKCPIFITPQMNSLEVDWIAFAKERGVAPHFWLNPPYSHPVVLHFAKKAFDESQRGATVLGLFGCHDMAAKWFQKYVKPLPKIRRGDYDFREKRINFIPPPGVKPSSNMYSSLEILWLPPGEE